MVQLLVGDTSKLARLLFKQSTELLLGHLLCTTQLSCVAKVCLFSSKVEQAAGMTCNWLFKFAPKVIKTKIKTFLFV